ncbi:hypothetical protein ABVC46_01750 [Lactobacillus crispatus]|uniref:Conjugal transfer protein n=1 Tax=Lactobacillus crispatus TaxID=47770 RepID=A0AAW8WL34_9LACO|nr:hypothetical protein [Lactobacillus crispatus]MCT7696525.1 hypothetical protein [Lactobacillus crispatus]MCT7707987.1 hypothetical protein [Lactobacillus crispatus]MCT7731600.1 hypothetical protein [Lactobacillus crispatus]MCT7802465.1 hypothetical protein [Lactobacillus crispatus]MCT7808018.1 hypothetical protein [Lactobacillus crispatus]
MRRPNRSIRNQSTNFWPRINPWVFIGITGALAFILLLSCYTSYQAYHEQQQQIASLQVKNKKLKAKYAEIKPKKNIITRGKFDLTKHQGQLDKAYNTLLKYAYGTARKPSDITKHSDLFIKYFGNSGYSQIRDIAFDSNHTPLAKQNIATRVAFSDFDIANMTETITSYTTFYLTRKKKQPDKGVVYLTCTYNYQTHSASNTDLQFSSLD